MLHRGLIGAGIRLAWKRPNGAARKLQGFATTEQGSFLTLQLAALQTGSPERSAMYLRHAREEARHAQLFDRRARELSTQPLPPLSADAEDLFQSLGEVRFLAFVCHAEGRGRRQFEVYRSWFSDHEDGETAKMLDGIIEEEHHHERYSYRLLTDLVGSEEKARREMASVRRWEAWRAWRRVGRATSYRIYVVLVWLMLPLLILYGPVVRLLRPVRTGFVAAQGARKRGD